MCASKRKLVKLKLLQNALRDVSNFLKLYLPIANAHMTDFIVKDWWNKFLPESIRDELLLLTDKELAMLPSGKLHHSIRNCGNSGDVSPIDDCQCLVICGSAEIVLSGDLPKWDESVMPNWKHHSLGEFISACQERSLPNLGVLTDIGDVLDNTADVISIKEFMSPKKQHEVETMTEICAALSKKHGIDIMVDIGSGKGYLSSHLSLRHGLRVLGIDASSTNTDGAAGRNQRLGKQWNGLVKRSKKQQKQISGSGSFNSANSAQTCVNPDDRSHSDNQASGTSPVRGKFVAITQYVDKLTDIQQLLRIHLRTSVDIPNCDNSLKEIREKCSKNSIASSSCACLINDPEGLTNTETCHCYLVENVSVSLVDKDANNTKCETCSRLIQANVESNALPRSLDVLGHEPSAAAPGGNLDSPSLLYMLGGLHACGDLTANTLRLFVEKPEASVLCNVGCCYHHLTEAFIRCPFGRGDDLDLCARGFPLCHFLLQRGCQLGRNARMLASQSPDRITDKGNAPNVSLYWRALLQVMLRDMTGQLRDDWQVGRIAAKCENFTDYVHTALQKLGFDDQIPETVIEEYMRTNKDEEKFLRCFVQFKAALAPCIEALVILDRACYLMEQDNVDDVNLVQAFDPIISPRCYAIIASKSHQNQ